MLVGAVIGCKPAPSLPHAPPPSHASAPRDADADRDDAPPGEAPGKVIVITSDECGFILDQVYFEHNSADLRDPQRPILDATADMFRCFLRTGEITKWQVIGNADATERDPQALSVARARAVAAALVSRGVAASTLDIMGAGASQPLDPHGTPEARAKNRRVFFLVLQRRDSSP
jgi:outer membrane protein OmpA-like peptidoglycan-associated protein